MKGPVFSNWENDKFSIIQWRHNGRNGVWNHQPHDCLLNRLFRRRSKKTSKFLITGLCGGISPVTGEFPAQMASNTEKFPFDDVRNCKSWRAPGANNEEAMTYGHLFAKRADVLPQVSMPQDLSLDPFNRSEIWHTPWQQCYRETSKICEG